MLVVRRISKVLALIVVYIICAYGYLTSKGFVFTENGPVLSNQAYAKENTFSQKVDGDIHLSESCLREMGDENAPLTMYGYSSMACSHCKDFHKFILPKIERDFISKGKLKFIFIHFPLDVRSMRIAKLSYCLPNNKYYEFISDLYDNRDWQFAKNDDILGEYAKKFGMTDEEIEECNSNTKLTSDILLTRDNAIKTFGVQGTPSFIVEGTDGKELIVGSRSYEDLKEYLNKRLGSE